MDYNIPITWNENNDIFQHFNDKMTGELIKRKHNRAVQNALGLKKNKTDIFWGFLLVCFLNICYRTLLAKE